MTEKKRGFPRINFTIDPALWERFLDRLEKEGITSKSGGISAAITHWMRSHGGEVPEAPVNRQGAGQGRESARLSVNLPIDTSKALSKYARRIGKKSAQIGREAVLLYIERKLKDEPEFDAVEAWRLLDDPDAAL